MWELKEKKKKKDEDALEINSSVYVLRADTCKHCIFFFLLLYSLINTWTTKHFPCINLSVIHRTAVLFTLTMNGGDWMLLDLQENYFTLNLKKTKAQSEATCQ